MSTPSQDASMLDRARQLHAQGHIDEARAVCAAHLRAAPGDFEAWMLLGILHVDADRLTDALDAFLRATQLEPQSVEALCNLGAAELSVGQPLQAVRTFRRTLEEAPDVAVLHHNLGRAHEECGDFDAARASYERAVGLDPMRAEAQRDLARALERLGRLDEARAVSERALSLDPRDATAHYNLGVALLGLDKLEAAVEAFHKALALHPQHPEAHNNLGYALQRLGRTTSAVVSFDRALLLKPDFAEALNNRGIALLDERRAADALASFEQALHYQPRYVNALANHAAALLELDRVAPALASCERALAIEPHHTAALSNRASVLWRARRYGEAARTFTTLLAADADFDYARGGRFHARLHCCEWQDHAAEAQALRDASSRDADACQPFTFLLACDDATAQRRCAERFVAKQCAPVPAPLCSAVPYTHERIRVAYVSADLRDHPVAHLTVELFERHDRRRFEVTAVSLGPAADDPMRRRLRAAFEHFIDARDRSDRAVAEELRAREIDIAIDLTGNTQNGRPRIFARRPAPIQVSYLGYPGTSGAPYMDYLIADGEVVPPEHREHYSEQIAFLPECFQPNDSKRLIAAGVPTRAEQGLPEQGFVFCCFNASYKITPSVFGVWMQLLRQTPGSVLWLREVSVDATLNLRAAAQQRGVEPERLCFAARTPDVADHLARQRCADLFLDTFPYNAHTTASDALSAGLPVLTYRGRSLVSRVAASLLKAVGLPELVTDSLEEYAARALELAHRPAELAALRVRLAQNRAIGALFDAERYCRDFEAALERMHEGHQRGLPAATFTV